VCVYRRAGVVLFGREEGRGETGCDGGRGDGEEETGGWGSCLGGMWVWRNGLRGDMTKGLIGNYEQVSRGGICGFCLAPRHVCT
jgi:hypothetical protein